MSLHVYAAETDLAALTTLLKDVRAEAPWAILERPDCPPDFPAASEMPDAATWPTGRIFGEQVEVHWEQEGPNYKVRMARVGEQSPPAEFSEVLMVPGEEPAPIWYYLWGEDEIAIGGRLDYWRALPGKGRARLSVAEYRDARTGRLLFYRYAGLERQEATDE